MTGNCFKLKVAYFNPQEVNRRWLAWDKNIHSDNFDSYISVFYDLKLLFGLKESKKSLINNVKRLFEIPTTTTPSVISLGGLNYRNLTLEEYKILNEALLLTKSKYNKKKNTITYT